MKQLEVRGSVRSKQRESEEPHREIRVQTETGKIHGEKEKELRHGGGPAAVFSLLLSGLWAPNTPEHSTGSPGPLEAPQGRTVSG
ncbi:Hypothetical predicted protein [Xyrichtys novacula]|uniref:Uncharacterized protein n=1 Tax=Xyrichtys novacula TaxID=13765 RepID=A0AAV1H6E4_XYRNO|nr:Hypothetical predicted protein [Xyrichtys novacula]